MKSVGRCIVLGLVLAGMFGSAVSAQEGRVLPTLLIRGDVVSLDVADPSAILLTVKDRYGFETPIYLGEETAITEGENSIEQAALTSGTTVEVEYNFDVNTAKRHAVSVNVVSPVVAAATVAEEVPVAEAAPEAEVPAAETVPIEEPAADAPEEVIPTEAEESVPAE